MISKLTDAFFKHLIISELMNVAALIKRDSIWDYSCVFTLDIVSSP